MIKRYLTVLAVVIVLLLAVLQLGSIAIFASAGTPLSLPAHLSPRMGQHIYGAVERALPVSYVESLLATAAFERHDLPAARLHADRMSASVKRSDFLGRIALLRGDRATAMKYFLEAGDVYALQAEVGRLAAGHQLRQAYHLENATRARVARSGTHPDSVADSAWRSGVLATALAYQDRAEFQTWMRIGLDDYRNALALAPFSEKYLLAAGTQCLGLGDYQKARAFFQRSADVDPASADAYAGLGMVALGEGDRAQAQSYASRSLTYDSRSKMLARLTASLR